MILKDAANVFIGSKLVKKIYLGSVLVYTYITSAPPIVSEENMIGSSSAESYEEGSTTWGDLTLSAGCTVSKDGIEVQDDETYVSSKISGLSYPMTFEFKGRLDSGCYKVQDSAPGMLFGLAPTINSWGEGINCYATSDYGIIFDTTGAMTITTNVTPTYTHIIFTINSSGKLTVYINGISNSWTASGDSATRANKTYLFNSEHIGRFVGAINTIRWWDTELSTAEITELFSKDGDDYTL